MTEGRIGGEHLKRRLVVGVCIFGASAFLNGPQQRFSAGSSFISSGQKVLSDSSAARLLLRGARFQL